MINSQSTWKRFRKVASLATVVAMLIAAVLLFDRIFLMQRLESRGAHVRRTPDSEVYALGLRSAEFGDADLRGLHTLSGLERLELHGAGFTDAGMPHVAEIQSLTKLTLADTTVTDAGLASLADLPRLETLHLEASRVALPGLKSLESWPALELLHVDAEHLEFEDLVELERHLGHVRVSIHPSWAMLGRIQAPPGVALSWSSTSYADGLRILFSGTAPTSDFLRNLSNPERVSSIEQPSTMLFVSAPDVIDALLRFDNLQSIQLRLSECSDAQFQSLCRIRKLRRLRIEHTRVTDEGLRSLEDLQTLEEFSLRSADIHGPGLDVFASLPQLRRLSLHVPAAHPDALSSLESLDWIDFLSVNGEVLRYRASAQGQLMLDYTERLY